MKEFILQQFQARDAANLAEEEHRRKRPNLLSEFVNEQTRQKEREELLKRDDEDKERAEVMAIIETMTKQQQEKVKHQEWVEDLAERKRAAMATETNRLKDILYTKSYRDESNQIERDKLTGSNKQSSDFDKKMQTNEADRTSGLIVTAAAAPANLEEILAVKNALAQVSTGRFSQYKGDWELQMNENTPEAAAYGTLVRFGAKDLLQFSKDMAGSLSNEDREFLADASFGKGQDKKVNERILEVMQRAYENQIKQRSFYQDYKKATGSMYGAEDAWYDYLNDASKKKSNVVTEEPKATQELQQESPPEKKRETQQDQQNTKIQYKPGKFDEDDFQLMKKHESFNAIDQMSAGFGQSFLDTYHGVQGKEAPQVIPKEKQNGWHTVGDAASYLVPMGVAGKVIGKAAAKVGPKAIKWLQRAGEVGTGAGIKAAKDYENRERGAKEGAVEVLAGNAFAKVAGITLGSIFGKSKKAIKTKYLDALKQEEEKLSEKMLKDVLGDSKAGTNPSVETSKLLNKERKELAKISTENYTKALEMDKKPLVDLRAPKPSKILDASGNPLKQTGDPMADKIRKAVKLSGVEISKQPTMAELHAVRTQLNFDKNKLHNKAYSPKVVQQEKEEYRRAIKAIDDIFEKRADPKALQAYKDANKAHGKLLGDYTGTLKAARVARQGDEELNFAKWFNTGNKETTRKLYEKVSQNIRDKAAVGEFLGGKNVPVVGGAQGKTASGLPANAAGADQFRTWYENLMSKGTANAQANIAGKIDKGEVARLLAIPKEIDGVMKELSEKVDRGVLTKIADALTRGRYSAVTDIIEEAMRSTKDNVAIKGLGKLLEYADKQKLAPASVLGYTERD